MSSDNNDKRPTATQEKVQISIKLSESQAAKQNKDTCSKELDSVPEKLKKEKAPGLNIFQMR